MRSPKRRWKALLGGALALAGAASARGQFSSQTTGTANPTFRPGGFREGLTTTSLNEKADSELGGGATVESSLERDANAAQQSFFRTFQDGIVRIPKLGYGQGKFQVSSPLGPSSSLPLFGFAGKPETAHVKLGNFYLNVFSLSASALVSDNIDLTELGAKTDEIAVVRLQAGLIFQINEAMRLSAAGTVVWLPLKNNLGFTDPQADYGASVAPLFQTQFTYDIPFNKVDVTAVEDFSVQSGSFGVGGAFDLLDRRDREVADTAGRYSYRDTQTQGPTDRRFRAVPSYRNVIGANVSTLLPTVTRLTFGYSHENIWQQIASLGQSSSDSFVAELRSERENLRFKPYVGFGARHSNNRFGYDEDLHGGFAGPITPHLDLRAEEGYFLSGDDSAEGHTWRVSLAHHPRERLEHELSYSRSMTYPDRSLSTTVAYTARLKASPDIILEAGAEELVIEPIDNPNNSFGGKQFRVEGRCLLQAADRISTKLGYAWGHNIGRVGAPPLRFDIHTIRFELTIAHTKTFESSFLFQHEFRDSNRALDSYVENVISLTLTRKF